MDLFRLTSWIFVPEPLLTEVRLHDHIIYFGAQRFVRQIDAERLAKFDETDRGRILFDRSGKS